MTDQANIDQYTQRISDQQATIERLEAECEKLRAENELVKDQVLTLAAHAARLRETLGRVEWIPFNVVEYGAWCLECTNLKEHGHAPDCKLAAALEDPSPQADALAVVLGLMDKWQETAFKSDWESVDEDLFEAWDAYLAVSRGDDVAENKGDFRKARGVIPWNEKGPWSDELHVGEPHARADSEDEDGG